MRKRIPFIISLFLLIGGVGCEKENISDPAEKILGKWEMISYGGFPCTPIGYREFLPTGIVREYNYEQKQFTSFECEYHILNDTVLLMCDMRYEYLFFEKKMRDPAKECLSIFFAYIFLH